MTDSPPAQQQTPPGSTGEMEPHPRDEMRDYRGRGLLDGTVALVTGGDSGIGRAVSVAFAKEGADVAVAYLSEHADAEHTAELVRAQKTAHACGGGLVLTSLSDPVRVILELTALSQVFTIRPSGVDAVS